MNIGDRIKAKRDELGFTLEEVARFVGVSRQTIQKYESGVIANIPSDKIESLAFILCTTPSYLMGWDEGKGSSLTKQDEKEINDILSNTEELLKQEGLMFDGSPASPEAIESIISAMRIGMAMAKEKNKQKYTPKKYRKD